MKTLIIGFLVFCSWVAVSTKYYVCRIKNLCDEKELQQIDNADNKIQHPFDSINNSAGLDPQTNPGRMTVNFAFDNSDFNPDNTTDSFFEKSKNYLAENTTAKVNVIGHTDAVGSDLYNQRLGLRRAQSLLEYFESKGISRNRIIVESKGENDPADDNSTDSGRANNRRAVVTLK